MNFFINSVITSVEVIAGLMLLCAAVHFVVFTAARAWIKGIHSYYDSLQMSLSRKIKANTKRS